MPLTKLIDSLAGVCRHCGQKAGILQRHHTGYEQSAQEGWQQMVALAAQAAGTPNFSEQTLRQSMATIAQRARLGDHTVDQALEQGWKQGVAHAMSDGIISRQEEEQMRAFRDSLALEDTTADPKDLGALDRASTDRIMMEARLIAISPRDGDQHLQDLSLAIRQAGLAGVKAKGLQVRAWEAAVEGALEDGLVSLDEENALAKYISHFSLTQQDLDRNGVQTSLLQAAVIRDVTQGIVPQRQNTTGTVPFNLMKSEQLVWLIQDVDYLETVVRRERQGPSHGLSIRVARGLYYRPSTFRSRPIEWDETVHADTGLLEVWPESHWPSFALRQSDGLQFIRA